MNYTNEEIARAAGYTPENQPHDIDDFGELWNRRVTLPVIMRDGRRVGGDQSRLSYDGPDWRNDPGAVATWLLPVVQKRLLDDEFSSLYFGVFMDSWGLYRGTIDVECGNAMLYAPTWHECVIEAIMATREDKA